MISIISGEVVERALLNSTLEKVSEAVAKNHRDTGKGCLILARPDYTFTVTPCEREPSLRELQKMVAGPGQDRGLIQPVDHYLGKDYSLNGKPSTAYANEEGLLIGCSINRLGAALVNWPEPLVGPIVILCGCFSNE